MAVSGKPFNDTFDAVEQYRSILADNSAGKKISVYRENLFFGRRSVFPFFKYLCSLKNAE